MIQRRKKERERERERETVSRQGQVISMQRGNRYWRGEGGNRDFIFVPISPQLVLKGGEMSDAGDDAGPILRKVHFQRLSAMQIRQ